MHIEQRVSSYHEKELSPIEKARKERAERPYLVGNESLDEWLKRIGGPFVDVAILQICRKCGKTIREDCAEAHLESGCTKHTEVEFGILINDKADIVFPKPMAEKVLNMNSIKKEIERGLQGLTITNKGDTVFQKEFFTQPGENYFEYIKSQIDQENTKITVDKRADKSLDEWSRNRKKT